MTWFLITFLVGLIGALILFKLKVTGGLMIGSLVAVALFNIFTGLAYFPLPAKIFAQIISGAFIGMQVNRKNVSDLKKMVKPTVFLLGGLLIINIILGFIIYALSDCDLMTALFAAVPGGVADISIISHDMGADTSIVAVFQLFRMIMVLTFFPTLIFPITKYLSKRQPPFNNNQQTPPDTQTSPAGTDKSKTIDKPVEKTVLTLAIAFVFGILGAILDIPAGPLLFSTLSVSVLSLWTNMAYMPFTIKRFAMIVAGAFVGSSFVRENLTGIAGLILPMILLVVGYMAFCILLGVLMSRLFKIDIATALFSCTPAGASDMALLATDLGAAGPQVALLQIARLFCVITIFPRAIELVLWLWGLVT